MSRGRDEIILNVFAYIMIGVIAAGCVIPFLMVLMGSLQSEDSVLRNGFSLIPEQLDFTAYRYVFDSPAAILRAYGVSIFITGAGTLISLYFSSMAAYVLARKDVKYRNALAFYLFFTTLFNGGLVPYYLMIKNYLKIDNSFTILLLSGMFNVIYILIIRTYIAGSVPDSISESAKIDGANDFKIFMSIVLPLLKPVLAAIGLFIALGYWNDWYTSLLFVTNDKIIPLQYLLYKILTFARFSQQILSQNAAVAVIDLPGETLKLALTIVATGPIIFLYPFVQKHFVAGLTIGAVKG
ncbi:carbohydrate ABC transporter permease [Cohnella silvisoli]|uniref:Carbohydrate ABC transporter permease n=1 Tax=Cohnella silvisoli TaxID=2873699 RepID=A0ABV1KMH6_9BACL|nr:carbohydrate ABC transporter permease [Cohnella silvisoli]